MKIKEKEREKTTQLLLHLNDLNRYRLPFFQSQFGKDTKGLHDSLFLLFFFVVLFDLSRKELANTLMVFYALLVCSGEYYPLTMTVGRVVALR